ncbi:UDP-glucose:glycoprotein glucosyltransferase 1-like [Homarus americanus]|uniref:UDP-glucose:glycoprotein glucosyltransferase 1-like n=1 Tax=Homarus americanus TaxID=6706 RepID=A0A8J5MZ73_HOMAM|nr:UDP-glucose:glycoprotein glucosyltransferase 1-like [Homarus americanus]
MRESLLSLLWAFCTLLLLTGEVRGQAKVKPVTTHLSAKWTHTPLLLEATEYMREESTASFWSFAEAISQTDPVLYRDGSDKEIFAETLSVAGQFLSASQLRILKLSLSLRAYSPKIEMFSQIARDRGLPSPENCGAAVDVNGEVTCDIETMRQLVEKGTGTKPITYEVDHHYPGGENAKVGVVLYCELGSVEFQQFHQILKELVSAGKIDYILRHRVKNRSSKKVRLSGYGVELAIKSTEYKAQDDTKVQEDEERHEEDEEQEVEVEGFLFSKLESLHPEKEEELNQLRKHLEESRHEMAPMKVWQLQHLSMQAAQRIIESTQEYGIDIRDSAIMWMNNIETDKAYRKWPSTIGELLRPTYPGMLRSIKKNLHNLVIVADPVKSTTADLIRLVESFVTHSAPVRVGLVMSVNPEESLRGYDDAGLAMLCAFNYVAENMAGREDSNYKALQFLIEVYSSTQEDVTVTDVTNMFKSKYPSIDLDDVFDEDSDYDVGRMLAQDFVEKAGITNLPQALMNGVPLPEKHLNVDEFEEVVLMEVMRATQSVQRAVYNGELTNSHDVVDWLMALPNIMPRLNERILNTKSSTYIDLTDTSDKLLNGISVEAFSTFKSPEMSAIIANSCHYITTKSEPAVRPLTVWVVGDFDTYEGRDLLLEAVKYLRESNSVRLCAIHNRDTATDTTKIFSRAVEVAQATLSPAVARQFLAKVLAKENARKILDGSKKWTDYEISGLDMEAFQSRLASLKEDVFKIHSLYCRKVLSIAPRIRTVVANGRMLGTLKKDEKFVQEDFGLLEKYVQSTYGEKITEVLDGQGDILPGDISDMLMKVTGVLQTKPLSKGRTTVPLRSEQYSVVKVPPKDPDVPAFDVVVICDPVSTAAQKIGPIIMVLQEVINANIRIVLNSREKHSEMPLTSFYRYVLEPEPQFSEGGELTAGPHARFTGLPESPILTLNYHAPENWLVEVVQSIYDLDNIKLESVEGGVHSEFELEHLLLEGHCFEQSSGNPPRGLQFTLGNIQQPVMVDTIVMANLGYFQLKANPGAWLLRLRQGRSSDIYSIASHEGTDTPTGSEDVQIILSSFKSHVVKVRVAKKPGKQNVQLLSDDNEESGGLWNSITSTFSSSGGVEDEDETVNIFSVASGHLYERFLRIMMVSVLRHTKTPVKFWFVKNFLSPIFKDILPLLAKEYGFEYELVQYKWPRWLHQQTEKQRIIWGYKILFLDVLFPLDIKKIIFVDADQIVRADIKDLNNEDLDGAPYGFVPFCDSRKEIDGFRFWKQGYWRNHLAGRKYHISALFVVDLKKFRRIAAGDRLRGQYQGLSQDPNSLSNLDQDLPNNMVHQVRIKSLPQDWLWCESWCDDESKKTAKIIDLCNNPMTKEAKLEAAQRIIDEWTTYDNEIKTTIQNFKQNKSTQSEDSTSHKPHIEL